MKSTSQPESVGLQLSRLPDGRIEALSAGVRTVVRISVCFPWTAPGTFVSLRDDNNVEVALIEDIATLDGESRGVLEQGLREANFSFEITAIRVLKLEFEIRHWEVECVQGVRRFQTPKEDWPHRLPPNGLLITDVAGDIYKIPDWTMLDRTSRRLLKAYLE